MEHQAAFVPRLQPGIDVRRLPIAPEDAFVLSRIDGRATVREIHLSTGLPLSRVVEALEILGRLGALQGVVSKTAAAPAATVNAPVPPPISHAKSSKAPSRTAKAVESSTAPAGPDSALATLDAMVRRIETDDHYALLGVPRGVDKKEIKAAYFALVANYHPDKYYGRDLGEVKSKLERVFQALTTAHETLTRSKSRAAYDSVLGPAVTSLEPKPSEVIKTAPGGTNAEHPMTPEPQAPAFTAYPRATSTGTAATVAPGRLGVAPKAPPVRQTAQSSRPEPAPEPPPMSGRGPMRGVSYGDSSRASVARKLSGMSSALGRGTSAIPASTVGTPPSGTAMMAGSPELERALKKLASLGPRSIRSDAAPPAEADTDPNARPLTGVAAHAMRHVEESELHSMNGNLVASMNSLRLAATFLPNDREIRQKLEEAQLKADAVMADSHINHARHHERSGEWRQAGDFYARAARGRASGELYAQAAQCYRKDPSVLRHACDQAKLAVTHNPTDAAAHRLLAEIYAEAGMRQSAIASLEKAASQFPKDDAIHTLLSRLKSGGS